MTRTPHVHILDTGEGDWGAYPDEAKARRAIAAILNDFNEFADTPMTLQELTIIPPTNGATKTPIPAITTKGRPSSAPSARHPAALLRHTAVDLPLGSA